MKCLNFISLLAMIIYVLAESDQVPENAEPTKSLGGGGVSRFLAQKPRVVSLKCNNYPSICRFKGSPGPDCCKKTCVDTSTDTFNCGKCGRKCKYTEFCCKGKCVFPLADNNNCGGCSNK